MNNLKFDKAIKEKVNDNISHNITNSILDTTLPHKKNKTYSKLIKTIFIPLLIPTLALATTGIIINFGLSNHGLGDKKVTQAITNSYVQTDGSNNYIYTDEVNYKFDNVLVNDNLMLISLKFNFNKDIQEFSDISFTGLKIMDEKNNQIYIDSEDQMIWENNIASSFRMYTNKKDSKSLDETLILTSPKFNNMEKINIAFDSIVLYLVENGSPKTYTISSNSPITISLDAKFNNRDTTYYKINNLDLNDTTIGVTEVMLTNTGLGVVLEAPDLYSTPSYKIELQDNEGNTIYSMTNVISITKNNKMFVWLDIDSNFDKNESFRLLISNNSKTNTYSINK